MAKDVELAKAASVVTTRSATGTPQGTVDYPKGWKGSVPDAHAADLEAQGVLVSPSGEKAKPDAAAVKPATDPAALTAQSPAPGAPASAGAPGA